MITVLGTARRCCDGLTRRETLRVGALSLLGGFMNEANLLALEQRPKASSRRAIAKSVLLINLQGGPPTQDMYDLKPNAPDRIRSEFKPIATSAPGVQVCELLPRLAKWMHKAAVVRSVYHNGGCHNDLPMYTGYDVPPPNIETFRVTDPPSMGSVLSYLEKRQGLLPSYVYLPCGLGWGEYKRKPGFGAGFLGQKYEPACTECKAYVDNPPDTQYRPQIVRGEPVVHGIQLREGVTVDQLNRRRSLMEQLGTNLRHLESQNALRGYSSNEQRAFDILNSAQVRAAFDLRLESPRMRDRYGHTLFGSSMLLGRRLIERGVRFVNVSWDNFSNRFQVSNEAWDTHKNNFPILKNTHLPSLDQTVSALMEDLDSRGLLDQTLIVMMGEMGRHPEINGDGGRDHWTSCYSVFLAGAGVRGGTVYGTSDAHARFIKDRPVHIKDIVATVYHCLGIDPETPVYDQGKRPIAIAHGGQPVLDILA
jgi:hypothetical protein